jgi:hypothetical protein
MAIAGIVAKTSNSLIHNGIPIIKIPEDGQKLIYLIKNLLPQKKGN